MKLFGHPIHMMLIHFPSALFPMDFVCSLLTFYYGVNTFINTSYFSLIGGVVLGVLAIITGAADLIGIVNNKPSVVKKALIHGGINTLVISAYSILAFSAFKQYPNIPSDNLTILITKGCLVTFMFLGNYIGGSLILKDKIGLKNKSA